jgi:peptide/nickel transport system permease protein
MMNPNPDLAADLVSGGADTIAEASFLRDTLRAFRRNRMAMVGLAFVMVLVFCAVFAPWISPHDPYRVALDDQLLPASTTYWLGTDNFGRDVLTRILYGARVSLVVGIVPSLISLAIGTALGILSGYLGGKTDFAIMRLADMMIAFPSLLLAMVVMYTLGANLLNIFIALALVGWASVARVVRAQTLALREKEFIEGARANGTARSAIMFSHIFPNVVPTLIVLFSLSIPEAIMWESSLSFLGVGVQPPEASWGLLVAKGKEYMFQAPSVAIAPGVAILLTVLAFNFIGDGLRDALDPSMKD